MASLASGSQLARYQWVMHLETAAPDFYKISSIRTESALQAERLNKQVKQAWRLHPRRIIIPNATDFPTKIQLAIEIVRGILEHRSADEIRRLVQRGA
jgi:hypothetical protein